MNINLKVYSMSSWNHNRGISIMWNLNHVESQSCGITITWNRNHVESQSGGITITWDLTHVESQSRGITFMWNHNHVKSQSRGITITWNHNRGFNNKCGNHLGWDKIKMQFTASPGQNWIRNLRLENRNIISVFSTLLLASNSVVTYY